MLGRKKHQISIHCLYLVSALCCFRVNGKLVALKVIRLQEEEGTPFTAIREGKKFMDEYWKIINSSLQMME